MPAMLEVANLFKTYGEGENAVDAVRDVSFTADSGDFLGIIGPSGSGKTTLLAMVGGLLTPSRGTVRVGDRDLAKLSSQERAVYRRTKVGYVFQANNLLPYLTTRENLLVMKAIGGSGDRRRADQLLEELDLTKRANTPATNLSGGERQRAAIARALMNDPDLVLVDEPTASLDSGRGRQVVQMLIDEVKQRGKLALMVTHDIDMARMADRVLTMRDGALESLDDARTAKSTS